MKWYKKYTELPSTLFTYENSGQRWGDALPYRSRRDDNFDVIDIVGDYGMNQLYKILGYTESPPFPAPYPYVAIMFEESDTFKKIWWHYENF